MQLGVGTPKQLLEDHYMQYCQDAYDDFVTDIGLVASRTSAGAV